jgi:uncharacterized protein
MKRTFLKLGLLVIYLILILSLDLTVAKTEKLSLPGSYSGDSLPVYDQWIRISRYITVRDGVKLAADIFRPAVNGNPVDEPLPLIWTLHRYQRDWGFREAQLVAPWLETLLKHGYVIASVDVRGGGASFGSRQGELTANDANDAYDVTEWFASQPWCNGRIGMYGRSYMGEDQYLAAGAAPPHLRAIFLEMAMFDLYDFAYPGGVFRDNFVRHWDYITKNLDQNTPARPVDEDSSGSMAARARKEHLRNFKVLDLAKLTFRDSRLDKSNIAPFFTWNPSSYLDAVKQSGVGVYILDGWYDLYSRDALIWFKNLNNPRKIVIGPWSHSETDGFDLAAEQLRWWNYWLKGIETGIMNEAPVRYYTMGAPTGKEWRTASQWPLPEEKPTKYFLGNGPSKSVKSVNDGLLDTQSPSEINGRDEYRVNYQATTGTSTRWNNGYGSPFYYPDMASNDEKCLTYTTGRLNSNLEVTGHPVVNLWVTSTARDGDFFVYLEEVDETGYSQYITEGVLRASHRMIAQPAFDYLGLPYHRSYAGDKRELPAGEPVELIFDLLPISKIFRSGNRIRVSIAGADLDNAQTPKVRPVPKVSIYRSVNYASYIILPIIPYPGGVKQ